MPELKNGWCVVGESVITPDGGTLAPDAPLTVAEVAKMHGKSTDSVLHAIKTGSLAASKFGRDWAIDAADAAAWVAPPRGRRWPDKQSAQQSPKGSSHG